MQSSASYSLVLGSIEEPHSWRTILRNTYFCFKKRFVFLLGGKQLGPAGWEGGLPSTSTDAASWLAMAVIMRREVGPSVLAHVGGPAGSAVHSNFTMFCVHLRGGWSHKF